jgi:hypothetical protein
LAPNGQFAENAEPHVTYPFTSPLCRPLLCTGKSFERSDLSKWSGRAEAYDINFDGVAHIGMIPDMVEEMRVLLGDDIQTTTTTGQMAPFWHGAEAYLNMWETALRSVGHFSPETGALRENCAKAREELMVWHSEVPFSEQPAATRAAWSDAMSRLRSMNCQGA